MKKHDWTSHEDYCGPFGYQTFWTCKSCGANGGVLKFHLKKNSTLDDLEPFFPCEQWCRVELPQDCDEAKTIIADHYKICEFRKDAFEAERKKQDEFNEQVRFLERLALQATRGEWWVNDYDGGVCAGPDGPDAQEIGDLCSGADACYVAAAYPDFILKIIAELRRLQDAMSG